MAYKWLQEFELRINQKEPIFPKPLPQENFIVSY